MLNTDPTGSFIANSGESFLKCLLKKIKYVETFRKTGSVPDKKRPCKRHVLRQNKMKFM